MIAVEGQKQRGEFINPDRSATSFEEGAGEWLATRSHLKPKTLEGYKSLLRSHVLPRFGRARLDRIDTISVETWVSDLQATGLSASRVRQAHQVLSAVLRSAVRNRYLPSNPASGVRLPREQHREMLFLNADEVDRLADAILPPYGVLIYLLAYGGMRWGEAAALRRSRIDVLRSQVEIAESVAEVGGRVIFGPTKNHKRRTIALPRFLRDMLNDHLTSQGDAGADAMVFTSPGHADRAGHDRGPLRHANFRKRVWLPAVESAELPTGLRIHDLRHTAAALLIAEGGHPEAIKRHLGHSSIVVTMDRYGHLFPSDVDVLAQRLDDAFRGRRTDMRRTN